MAGLTKKTQMLYDTMKENGADVGTPQEFQQWFFAKGEQGYKNRKQVWQLFHDNGADVGKNYEEMRDWLGLHQTSPKKSVQTQKAQQIGSDVFGSPGNTRNKTGVPSSFGQMPTPGETWQDRMRDNEIASLDNQSYGNPENPHVQAAKQRAGDLKLERDAKRGTKMKDVYGGFEQQAAINDTFNAIKGDQEAAARIGLPESMQQLQDEKDYASLTDGEMLQDKENIVPFTVNTLGRDENGNPMVNDEGEVITGFTSEEPRVAASDYYVKSAKEEHDKNELRKQTAEKVDEALKALNAGGGHSILEDIGAEEVNYGKSVGTGPTDTEGHSLSGDNFAGLDAYMERAKTRAQYNDLLAAKHLVSEAQGLMSEINKQKNSSEFENFLRNIPKGAADQSVVKGVIDFDDNRRLIAAIQQFEKDKSKLTEEQKLLLDAAAINTMVQSEYLPQMSTWSKAGQTTGGSASLMLEIAAAPLSGLGKQFSKQLTKKIFQASARRAAEKGSQYAVSTGAKRAARLATAGAYTGATALRAPLLTGTIGAPRVAADALQRMQGDIQYGYDENGEFHFAGANNQQEAIKAFRDAFVAGSIENFTEMENSMLLGGFKLASQTMPFISRVTDGLRATKLGKIYSAAGRTELGRMVRNVKEHTGLHDFLGENLEEIEGGVLNALFVGDNTIQDVFKTDNLVDIGLGVAPMQMFFGAISLGGYSGVARRAKRNIKVTDANGAQQFGQEEWDKIKAAIDGSKDVNELKNVLTNVISGGQYSNEAARAAYDYARAREGYKGAVLGEAAAKNLDMEEKLAKRPSNIDVAADGQTVVQKNQNGDVISEEKFDDEEEAKAHVDILKMQRAEQDFQDDLAMAIEASEQRRQAVENGTPDDFPLSEEMEARVRAMAMNQIIPEGVEEGSPEYEAFVRNMDTPGTAENDILLEMMDSFDPLEDTYETVAVLEDSDRNEIDKAIKTDPVKRTERQQKLVSEVAWRLHMYNFPKGELHPEQSFTDGQTQADLDGAGTMEADPEAMLQMKQSMDDAQQALDDAVAQNTDLAAYVNETINSNEPFAPEDVISGMIGRFSDDEIATVADYINAQSKLDGYLEYTNGKIQQYVERETSKRAFKGKLNGAPSGNMVMVTDGENRYFLVNGDVQVGENGEILSAGEANGIVVVDEEGNILPMGLDSSLRVEMGATLEEYAASLLQQQQENTTAQMGFEAPQEDGNNESNESDESNGAATETPPLTPPEGEETAEEEVEEAPQETEQEETVSDEKVSEMDAALAKIPTRESKKGGEPDYIWEDAPAEDTIDALAAINDGNMDAVSETATMMRKEAESELKKAEKLKTSGKNPIEMAKSRAENKQKVEEAQKRLDYWKAVEEQVKGLIKQAEEAPLRQAEEEDASTRAAIIEEKSDNDAKWKALHQLYDGTIADDGEILDESRPMDINELVAMNMPRNIAWESYTVDGTHVKRGLQDELGSHHTRGIGKNVGTNAFNTFLAKKGTGISIDEAIHQIWESGENELANGEKRFSDQEIRNAVIDMFLSAEKPSDITNYVVNNRSRLANEKLRQEEEYMREQEANAYADAEAQVRGFADADEEADYNEFIAEEIKLQAEYEQRTEEGTAEQMPPVAESAEGGEQGEGGTAESAGTEREVPLSEPGETETEGDTESGNGDNAADGGVHLEGRESTEGVTPTPALPEGSETAAEGEPSGTVASPAERIWKAVDWLNGKYGYTFKDAGAFIRFYARKGKAKGDRWIKDKFPPKAADELIENIAALAKQTQAQSKAQTDIPSGTVAEEPKGGVERRLSGLSDAENDRLVELRKKLKNVLNRRDDTMKMEVIPGASKAAEIISIGTEIGFLYAKNGMVKFREFCENLILDIGEEIRPYLKSIYNAARYYPGMEDIKENMSSFEEVDKFDVANFDKETPDLMDKAKQIRDERKVEKSVKDTQESINYDKQNGNTVNVNKTENNEPKKVVSSPKERDLFGDSAEYSEREDKRDNLIEKVRAEMASRVAQNASPLTMSEVKKMAASAGLEMKDTDLQELVETAAVMNARAVASVGFMHDKTRYDRIVKYYQMQPLLNKRDSDRVEKQQYSTPTPFAYLMGMFMKAGKDIKSVLEPSAGNGALTICFPKDICHVNDIDHERLVNLRRQGFKEVTSQDGTKPFEGEKVDGIVTNPPFGSSTPREYDGHTISSLEGQMAINALDSMKDDGRAAIIIGGNTEYGQNGAIKGTRDKSLMNYLYDNYNVIDVINIAGELYGRNGTKYPTRMILIAGRRTDKNTVRFAPVFSKARPERVTTFDELYNRVEDDIRRINEQPAQTPASNVRDAGGRQSERQPGNTSGSTERVRPTSVPERESNEEQPRPAGRVGNGDARQDAARPVAETGSNEPSRSGGNERTAGEPAQLGGERLAVEDKPSESAPKAQNIQPSEPKKAEKAQLGQEKVAYPRRSRSGEIGSVVPANQSDALTKVFDKFDDIDQYLVDKLGYSDKNELYSHLAAEQIDSVALAIAKMEEGGGFIIGDMTGVGKGRQAAALIRYAVRSGKKPIFFTVKKTLFSDIYRDLVDIGSKDLKPLIFAASGKSKKSDNEEENKKRYNDAAMTDEEGNLVYDIPKKKEEERVLKYVEENGTLPPEYDYAVTTYDTVKSGMFDFRNGQSVARDFGGKVPYLAKSGQKKRDFIEKLAKNNFVIMDESHNASGKGGGSGFMQHILPTMKGVTFLSATFAKRPDNMPLYAMKTAMSKSGVKADKLIEAIIRGGTTLQEIMSRMLTEAGEMIRRERDFTGVTIDWLGKDPEVDKEEIEKQEKQFDALSEIFSDIVDFQTNYVQVTVDAISDELAEMQADADFKKGTKFAKNSAPFASKMYNLTQQLLFSLKVNDVVNRVISDIKAGLKPVIAVNNTMEGFIDDMPLNRDMKEPDLSSTLIEGLDGCLRITENHGDTKVQRTLSLSELTPEAQRRYKEIAEKISKLSTGLTISPIDAIKNKLKAAGYSVGELTGRKSELRANADGTVRKVERMDTDKKKIARDFNNGKIDIVILNRSASTGISLHSSTKFKDQRQRVMVFAQQQADINEEVQMRGRIDRTGQVHRAKYEYIVSNIPAEQRLLMMFKAKLKSLDANTTASQKSKFNEMETVDVLNKYGDDIVAEYMAEHPEIYDRLADPLKWNSGGPIITRGGEEEEERPNANAATKVLGKLTLLPVKLQQQVLDEITERYKTRIAILDEAGENDLVITELPLKAKTVKKSILKEGVEPGTSFGDNTYLEKVEVDVLKKPMKAVEVKSLVEQTLDGKTADEYVSDLKAQVEEKRRTRISALSERRKETIENGRKRTEEKTRSNAEKTRSKGGVVTEEQIQTSIRVQMDSIKEKANDTYKRQKETLDNSLENFETALDGLKPGMTVVLPEDMQNPQFGGLSPHFGMFIGFKFNKDLTPSGSTAIFAALDGRRRITVPINNSEAIKAIISRTNAYAREARVINLSTWDRMIPTATRKNSYIITGNILQGLVSSSDVHGKLVSYTTDTGEVKQGVLMGESFEPRMLSKESSITTKLDAIRSGEIIESSDHDITIGKPRRFADYYELRVPLSKQRGGKYFLDRGLRNLVDDGDFETSGTTMRGVVREENLEKVLNYLSKNFGTKVTDEFEEVDDSGTRLREVEEYTEEEQRIIDDAKKNGTYMKAPNGKRTKLSEKQWVRVRTKAFKKWFGDWENDPANASKIVDENGEPMVVYHGSPFGGIESFDRNQNKAEASGLKEFGTYFTTNKALAEMYMRGRQLTDEYRWEIETEIATWQLRLNDARNTTEYEAIEDEIKRLRSLLDGKVYEVFLNIRDPKEFDAKGQDGWHGWHELKQDIGYKTAEGRDAIEAIAGKNNAAVMKEQYDGIIAHNIVDIHGEADEQLSGDAILVFDKDASKIKSATDNVGTYSSEDEGIRFREVDSVFFSNAERAVEGIKQEKATPEQWLKMIEKNGGLKAGEDKWMGLSEWLKGQDKKSLTKQEVLDFIRENQIQIEEVNYADQTLGRYDEHWDYLRAWLEENTDNPDAWYNTITENYGYRDGEGFYLNQGTRMPKQVTDMVDRINKSIDKSNPINTTRLSYTTKGLDNKKEIALVVPTVESWNKDDVIHFGDAGEGRAVAWVRFGETEGVPNGIDADRYHDYSRKMKEAISRRDEMVEQLKRYKGGMLTETQKRLEEEEAYIQQLRERYKDVADVKPSRVLVIDEIQSKRHQEGREKGYKPIFQNWYKDRDALEKYRQELYSKYHVNQITELVGKLTPEESERYDELVARYNESSPHKDGIPDAPFQKNWHELAMKRMLRYAAENGYDKIAWTKGEQQAERYNIGNLIREIEKTRTFEDGEVRFDLYSRDGHDVSLFVKDGVVTKSSVNEYEGKPLSDVVGKAIAEEMQKLDDGQTLEDQRLTIGAEGMQGFYDQILPRFMNKYGKKWGVKTGEVELPNVEEAGRKMWAVDVTPEMKESVMQGQPLFREGSAPANSQPAEKMKEHLTKLSKKIGVKVVFHDDASTITNAKVKEALQRGKKVAGWYDPKDNSVHFYMPNIKDRYEAEKTIWHEVVGHKGMRALLGEEGYRTFMRRLWMDKSEDFEEMHQWVVENYMRYGGNLYETIDEWFAYNVVEPSVPKTMWDKVMQVLSDVLRKLGFMTTPNMKDMKYMLWLSRNAIKEGDAWTELQRNATLAKLDLESRRRASAYGKDAARARDGFANTPTGDTEREMYRNGLMRKMFAWTEAHQDYMASAKLLMDAILKGRKVLDRFNFYMKENHADSKIKIMEDLYVRDYCKPMEDAINRCVAAIGGKLSEAYEVLEDYMAMKHGLERNREFFVRDWMEEKRKKTPTIDDLDEEAKSEYEGAARGIEQAFEDGTIETEEERDKELKKALEDSYSSMLDRIEEGWAAAKAQPTDNLAEWLKGLDDYIRQHIDDEYEAGKHDYSGLTSFNDNVNDNANLEDGYDYDDDAVIGYVMDMESKIGEENVTELWEQKGRMTQFALDIEHEAGLITDKNYDKVSQMFHWYMPLRKWDEDMAEDIWSYMNSKKNTYVGRTLMKAGGRKSRAAMPIGTMFAMGGNAISRAARNEVKKAFAGFVRMYERPMANNDDDHDNDPLVTELEAWVENLGTEENPDWVYSFPDIPENATADEVREAKDAWAQHMLELMQEGRAMRVRQGDTIPYRFESKKRSRPEHIVEVYEEGQPHFFIVNDNPRAAQAINGQLKPETKHKITAQINRFMSSVFTSYSPTFMARNAFRDAEFASSMLSVKEGWDYCQKFIKNYMKVTNFAGKRPLMFTLFRKFRDGTLDESDKMERYFKEFAENGGITGYVMENNAERWEKEILAGVKEIGENQVVGITKNIIKRFMEGVEHAGEAIENAARFATYVTSRESGRTVTKSVNDAKEVSVNFNRKGAGYKTESLLNEKGEKTANNVWAAKTAQYMRANTLFYNASLQGIMNTVGNAARNPWWFAAKFAIPPMVLGALVPVFNTWVHAMLDDDDDKVSDDPYADLPEYTRRMNMCLYIGHGKFLMIPLSIEHRAFFGLGDIMAGQTYDEKLKNVDKPLAVDAVSQLTAFSPVDYNSREMGIEGVTGWGVGIIVPAYISPLVNAYFNKSWTGSQIQKENAFGGSNLPEYQKAKDYTNKTLVGASRMWHELWGGNDAIRAGREQDSKVMEWIGEVSPAKMEYVVEQYFGEPGKLGTGVSDMFSMMFGKKEADLRKIPVVKAFATLPNENTQFRRANTKYWKYRDEFKKVEQDDRQYRSRIDDDPVLKLEYENKFKKSKRYKQWRIYHPGKGGEGFKYKKNIEDLQKRINAEDDLVQKRGLQHERNILVQQLVDTLDNIE